jgi:peptidase M23-like protein
MNRRNPSTEVLLLLAGAFTGRVGASAFVAIVAAMASLPALAFTHERAGPASVDFAGPLESADIGPPLPPPTATFEDVAKRENLEGKPSAADIRRARRVNRKTNRVLAANPYFRLYKLAKRRFGVSWYLVASVHYQKRNAAAHPRAAASAWGAPLFRHGLGSAAAWRRHRDAYRGAFRPRRYPHRSATHPSTHDDFDVIMAAAAELKAAGSRQLGPASWQALYALYGRNAAASSYATTVLERARAWKQLGTIPLPGGGELATPVQGSVPGCGYFHCPRPGHLHNGLDLSAPEGTPVHAADVGTVALIEGVGQSGGYGNFICIQHRAHLATCYAHLAAFAADLTVGKHVARGDVIGLVGSTGHSTGPHLHFEVRRGPAGCMACAVDPAPYLSGHVPDAPLPAFTAAAHEDNDQGERKRSRDTHRRGRRGPSRESGRRRVAGRSRPRANSAPPASAELNPAPPVSVPAPPPPPPPVSVPPAPPPPPVSVPPAPPPPPAVPPPPPPPVSVPPAPPPPPDPEPAPPTSTEVQDPPVPPAS